MVFFVSAYSGVCAVYTGIHSVVFDEQCQHIVAMCSLEGETVPLRNLVRISSLVEVRLTGLVGCTTCPIDALKLCMFVAYICF